MSTSAPLLIGLTGVARLAGVHRPVASMWRRRFATAEDPFPTPVKQKDGRPLFDALDVARWLERTEHGNNPEAVADAAASAAPAGFDVSDAEHVAAVDALLTLRAITGRPVGGISLAMLVDRARDVDPDDVCLRSEVERARLDWADWADQLADAAYSPLGGAHVIERRYAATCAAAGSAGPLTREAEELLITMSAGIFPGSAAELALGAGVEPALAVSLLLEIGEETDITPPDTDVGRRIRRRLLCNGMPGHSHVPHESGPRLHVVRLPSGDATGTAAILRTIDDLALSLGSADRAVILGPSSALTDSLHGSDDLARTDVLRSGRVRALVRLGAGLVSTAPREALGMWVLGPSVGELPIADRFTAVADLTDATLTAAARSDLTSDVLAAMGSARVLRAHAFRFARLARTTSLLAARGPLVSGTGEKLRARSALVRDLPTLIDQAHEALGDDAPSVGPVTAQGLALPPARLDALLADGHLRVLAGTRVDPSELSAAGLVAVVADDLDDPAAIGDRRIDPLVFAAQHPSARLTAPGDIVFRTAPTPRAWVDLEGSKVVIYPARVVRVDPADPGGLVPEIVAADIARATGGAGAWRRWQLRRVAPASISPLRATLADIATRRTELARRMDALDTYSDLLTSGVISGTVTLTDPAADAASDSQ